MKRALLLIVLPAATVPGQGFWPQWRGPDRNGIAKETNWRPDGKARKLWSKNVGTGYSNVSIADGRLFTIGHDEDAQKDTIVCLDATRGAEIWRYTFHAKTMAEAHKGGSLSTPSIDGKRVFVSSREGKLFCFAAATGKVRWHENLAKKHQLTAPTWGLSASPLVLDDMIVMNVGRVLSFERSGRLLWRTKDYGPCYSTPVDFVHRGQHCLAVFSGFGLTVLDRANGNELASSRWKTRYDVNAATPVVIGDKIFISSGYDHGCAMLQFDGRGLKTLWTSRVMNNHMSGCVAHRGHLYGFDESRLKCIDLGGKEKWIKRGLGKGALVIANGKLVVLGQRGTLAIAEATAMGYVELSRQKVFDRGGEAWTTPVLASGLVYCRSSLGELVCVDQRVRKPLARPGK